MKNVPEINPVYVLDVEGNKKSVILPIEEHHELLEDLQDLAIIAEPEEPVMHF